MIYPSYAVKVNTDKEWVEIGRILVLLNIDIKCIAEWPQTYYVNGKLQICQKEPLDIPILSCEEFISKYKHFYEELHDFIDNLKIGDKVVIEDRRGNPEYYPFSFVDPMLKYSGKEMTINGIGTLGSCCECQFYNGSDKCFYFLEDDNKYTWHSSMFVMPSSIPIKVLNLSDISINPLIIQ